VANEIAGFDLIGIIRGTGRGGRCNSLPVPSCAFPCLPASSYIIGQSLVVDYGAESNAF
jgi:hypothetical protein